MQIYIIWTCFLIFVVLVTFLVYKYSRKKKLSEWRKRYYINKINSVEKDDIFKQILVYDSVLSSILKDFWYSWTLWEQLKKKPRILNWKLNLIWEYHKIRNKIAHELDRMDEKNFSKTAIWYKKILREIINDN